MKRYYDPDFKIGILGGGQLGRMLIQEAANINTTIYILDPDKNAPCNGISHHFSVGNIKDFDTVYEFGKEMDLITIEIEHVSVEALEKLESEGIKVYPQPHIIKMVQDKGLQKEFYKAHNIPTAGYELLENLSQVREKAASLPFVQKMRKGGYDGRGVQVLKQESDLDKGFDEPSVLEEMVDFDKELSIIVARNESGDVKAFPIVELEFNPEANLVEFLFAPANVSTEIEEKAKKISCDLIEKLEMVGILAVEMFLTREGEVLVNEIAPRPHNSGHQTIEANETSQYEQHLRAILNLPLGSTKAMSPSVMVNLLGEKGHEGKVRYEGLEEILQIEGVHPHIYGKAITKPYRKMGHVTITDDSLVKAKQKAHIIKDTLKAISQ